MQNREIKFRAWDGTSMAFNIERSGQFGFYLKNWKCSQFTGMKDKNGKEIYEGDILRQKKDKGAMFKVFFDKDGKWLVEEIGESFGGLNHELWAWAQVTEVIGNVFENPKLLKSKK